jgi:hypothetical protein
MFSQIFIIIFLDLKELEHKNLIIDEIDAKIDKKFILISLYLIFS